MRWAGWIAVAMCACGSSPDDASDESSSGSGTMSNGSSSDSDSDSDDGVVLESSSSSGDSSGGAESMGTTGAESPCDCAADEICVEASTDGCFDPHAPSLTCVAMPAACEGVDPICDTECGWEICGGPLCDGFDAEVCDTPSPGFVCGGFATTCNLYAQDCGKGEKCTSWDSDADGKYDDTRCSPIAEAPVAVGDPCTSETSHLSGIDDCELGAMCLSDDPTETAGICRAACEGNPYSASCSDADTTCLVDTFFLAWCLPS